MVLVAKEKKRTENSELPQWVPKYLSLVRTGMGVADATKVCGTYRQKIWELKQNYPGFADDEKYARDEGSVQREIERQEREEAMARTHKRTTRKGETVALCGDRRAKKMHNWWDNVDCMNCWESRLPKEGEECAVVGCAKPPFRWIDKEPRCSEHCGLDDFDPAEAGRKKAVR